MPPGLEFIDPTNLTPERSYYCKQIKLPGDGVYHIKGIDKFSAYSYGYSDYESYGFLTAFATIDQEKEKDTLNPIVELSMDEEGNVPDPELGPQKPAFIQEMPENSKDRSNLSVVYFDQKRSSNYTFKCDKFVAGEDRFVKWSLKPLNPAEDARASIKISDRRGNDTTLVVQYWANKLAVAPLIKNFGKVKAGSENEFSFELVNNSEGGYSKYYKIKFKKGDQGFSIDTNFHSDEPLAPGEKREFKVKFVPPGDKAYSDSIGYGVGDNFKYVAYVSGEGSYPTISVYDANFPKTLLGSKSSPIIAGIVNKGSTTLVVTGFSGPSDGAFTTDLEGFHISAENPLLVGQNKEIQFKVWFEPTEKKLYQDSIVFITDANPKNADPVCLIKGEGWENISAPEIITYDFSAKVLPNPLDSRGGQIEFDNPSDGNVEIALFNSLNQQVAVLQSGWMKGGKQAVRIPVESLPDGAYTYRISAGNFNSIQNLIITK